MFPTPHTVGVSKRTKTGVDSLNVPTWEWSEPVSHRVCARYVVSSSEPFEAGHERVRVDAAVIAPSDFPAQPEDRITWDNQTFEVIGHPQDYTHGPWWDPGVKLWNLRRLEGQ